MPPDKIEQNGHKILSSSTPSRYKVLFLAPEDRFFCEHALPVARAALRNGYDVVVAAGLHSRAQTIRDEGFRLIPLRLKRNSYFPWNELRALRELARIYREERPDIVHHLSLKAILYGSIAASGKEEIHTVNAVTGLGFLVSSSSWKARLLRPVVWSACRRYVDNPNQRMLVENREDGQLLVSKLRVAQNRVVITPGAGVDVDLFRPSPELDGPPLVLLASRMLWIKGIADFVDAARVLRGRGAKARFVLVGDTDPSNPACIPRHQLLEWQASGPVEWWGTRADMPEVFKQTHLVCLPSHGGEGIPKVLMEAAACGRALVTTDVPGCRDIVRHGFNGVVVPPKDSLALASAIEELIDDPPRRSQMALHSRALAEEFSHSAVIRQILNIYRELLDRDNVPLGVPAQKSVSP